MLKGDLPAVLNFWHFGARLEAAGMLPLISVREMLDELGVSAPVPMLGWVFRESWATAHPEAIAGLLAASYDAKALLDTDAALWQRIAPLTKAEDAATLERLRQGYRDGIPRGLADNGRAAAAAVFDILAREGGPELVGEAERLDPGTFWSGQDSARLSAADAPR
jgi:NitT/TauT family transport system substrate-binding protein